MRASVAVALASILTVSIAVQAQTVDRVVAVVDGDAIFLSELRVTVAPYVRSGAPSSATMAQVSYESVRTALANQMRQERLHALETTLADELRRDATIVRMLDED